MGDDGWLPGFERVQGNDSGTWASDNEHAPKIVLHTTEGLGFDAARSAFTTNNSWPHLTVDPRERRRWQHVPLHLPARALRNSRTPGETNREGRVYQIEILGFAGQSHTWSNDDLDWLGTDVLRPLAAATGTPLTTDVTFHGEGAGWILASVTARQRLSARDWDTYTGVLGHQHVPENDHWDPGAINIERVLAAARGTGPSEEDTFMAALTPEEQRELLEKTRALHEVLVDADGRLAGMRSDLTDLTREVVTPKGGDGRGWLRRTLEGKD